MTTYTSELYNYLIAGDLNNFFIILFNFYFPFGSFFWIVGAVIFFTAHLKTKNLAFAGGMVSIYFVMISSSGWIVNAYSVLAMRWFGLGLGLIVGYYMYRMWRGTR